MIYTRVAIRIIMLTISYRPRLFFMSAFHMYLMPKSIRNNMTYSIAYTMYMADMHFLFSLLYSSSVKINTRYLDEMKICIYYYLCGLSSFLCGINYYIQFLSTQGLRRAFQTCRTSLFLLVYSSMR